MAEEEKHEAIEEISDNDVRKSKLFQKQAALASELKRKLEDLETAEMNRKAELDRKQAEEHGNWKALLEAKDKDIADKIASYQRDLLSRDVQIALVKEGVTNEIFLRGALASFKGNVDDIPDFVLSLKSAEENTRFFNFDSKAPAPGKVTPAVSGIGNEWRKLEKSSDPVERQKAREYLTKYYQDHGKFPD